MFEKKCYFKFSRSDSFSFRHPLPLVTCELCRLPTCLPVGTGLLNFVPSLSVFACLTKSMCLLRIEQCLLESIELASRDRLLCTFAKPNVPCFLNSYRGVPTQSNRSGNLRMTRWISPGSIDFKGLCEPQKWRVKLSSITAVAAAGNFRRNRSTNVHDLQDVSSTEVLVRIRCGLCWP